MNQDSIIRLAMEKIAQAGLSVHPEFYFDLTGGAAGCFSYNGQNMKLRFNMPIAEANSDKFHETVVHEVAHLVDYVRNGYKMRKLANGNRDMHGRYFKSIMEELGVEARTYHSYVVPEGRRQRRWEYTCSCMTHAVATVTHNRIQRGSPRICSHCRGSITFTGKQI